MKTGESSMAKESEKEKKNLIIETAEKFFFHYGFKKTTVDEIAQTAGIAKGTVYLYFKSKEDILIAIAFRHFKQSIERLEKKLSVIDDIREKLKTVIEHRPLETFEFINKHPHFAEILLFMEKYKKGIEPGKEYSGSMSRYYEILENTLNEGVEKKEFKIRNVEERTGHIAFMQRAFMPPYYPRISKEFLAMVINNYIEMLIRDISR
ncbi:MAG: TetR/AcrR family transcriptional regulator [bacterium]|nr:TetR/AcrR family transcriptional regulator [bacterium]